MAAQPELTHAERIRVGMRKAKLRGVRLGRPPLGVDHRKLAAKGVSAQKISKILARLEREVRKLTLSGASTREIAELLGCSTTYVEKNLRAA